MKALLSDWKIHALCLLMTICAELIGKFTISLGIASFTLYPMIYTIIMGILLAVFKVIPRDMMKTASPYSMYAILLLGARSAATIGPNLSVILNAGVAMVLQTFGHLATVLVIPIGVMIFSMGRSVVGAGFSISREGSLIVIGDKYGLDSEEGLGVMSAYITGTLLGTIVCSFMASLLVSMDIFHPKALALASGIGAAGMMNAIMASIMDAFPAMADELYGLAFAANTFTGLTGMYLNIMIALPLANKLYKWSWKIKTGGKYETKPVPSPEQAAP